MTEKFAVVPDDFRMLGGDKKRDTYDPNIPAHKAVSFQCFGPGYDRESLPGNRHHRWRSR
jgi:hypothetical protein